MNQEEIDQHKFRLGVLQETLAHTHKTNVGQLHDAVGKIMHMFNFFQIPLSVGVAACHEAMQQGLDAMVSDAELTEPKKEKSNIVLLRPLE